MIYYKNSRPMLKFRKKATNSNDNHDNRLVLGRFAKHRNDL